MPTTQKLAHFHARAYKAFSFDQHLLRDTNTMKLTVASRNPKSTKFPITLDLEGTPDKVTVLQVCQAIEKKFPKYYPDRQRLTDMDKKPLDHDKTLADLNITDGATIQFKDLGKYKMICHALLCL